MISILSLLALTAVSHADTLKLAPVAFSFEATGSKARALFEELLAAGAPIYTTSAPGSRAFAVDGLMATERYISEAGPCQDQSGYIVTFHAPTGEQFNIDESKDCKATKAKALYDTLQALGANKVTGFSKTEEFFAADRVGAIEYPDVNHEGKTYEADGIVNDINLSH